MELARFTPPSGDRRAADLTSGFAKGASSGAIEAVGLPSDSAQHLLLVQNRRNAFLHGDPTAIDDVLVDATLDKFLEIQLAGVALYNMRCTGKRIRAPLWEFMARVGR